MVLAMNRKPYFLLTKTEDGTHVENLSAEGVQKDLAEYKDYKPPHNTPKFATNVNEFLDNDELLLLIKGEIVVPSAVKTVTEWDIP